MDSGSSLGLKPNTHATQAGF